MIDKGMRLFFRFYSLSHTQMILSGHSHGSRHSFTECNKSDPHSHSGWDSRDPVTGVGEGLAFVYGPAAPCTSLLGCSSYFGILRKHACHHGFPEMLWEGQEGCVFGGEGQKKERVFNFQQELHGPQIAPRGQRNLKLFRFFLE